MLPQSAQNRLFGGFSAPYFEQRPLTARRNHRKNFLSAGLSVPHFEQRINSPLAQRFCTSFIILSQSGPLLLMVNAKRQQPRQSAAS